MEEPECDFGEVEDTKSSIRPQALLVQNTEVSHQTNTASIAWQYNVSTDSYDNPPLFSQLRSHIILKGLEFRGIDGMKTKLADEYMQQYNINAKNIYIKKYEGGIAADAYIGFSYDYEGYKILKEGNKIQVPLVDKKGGLGIPNFQVNELFDYLIKKNEGIIKQQMEKYQNMSRRGTVQFRNEKYERTEDRDYDQRKHNAYHRKSESRDYDRRRFENIERRYYSPKRSPSHSYSRGHSQSIERQRKVFIPDRPKDELYRSNYRERSNSSEYRRSRYSPREFRRQDYNKYERSTSRSPYKRQRSRSTSYERGRKRYEYKPSDSPRRSFNLKERQTNPDYIPPAQLEEGEIDTNKSSSKTCYALGIPINATKDDVLHELSCQNLPLPKQLRFFKKGNLRPMLEDGCDYLRMDYERQDYIDDLLKSNFKVLGHCTLLIQCESEVCLWDS